MPALRTVLLAVTGLVWGAAVFASRGPALAAPVVLDAATQKTYAAQCGTCHGKDGRGKTTAGKKAGTPDWTDPATFKGKSETDLVTMITDGVTKDGEEKMPAFGKKLKGDEILALVKYAESFQAPAP